MKAEQKLTWDIAYWNPTDKVTEEQLDLFLEEGTGVSTNAPMYYSVRHFVEAFNNQEISDMGWLYCTPRHKDGD